MERENIQKLTKIAIKHPKIRAVFIFVIYAMFLCSILHLAWVCFVLRKSGEVPAELSITAWLFGISYASVFFMWLITIPFSSAMRKDIDFSEQINFFLYKSIKHINPLRAIQNTGNIWLNFPMEVSVSGAIVRIYNSNPIIVTAIILWWFISMMLIWPQGLPKMANNSNFLFFCLMFASFYGAWSSTTLLALKAICYFFDKRSEK